MVRRFNPDALIRPRLFQAVQLSQAYCMVEIGAGKGMHAVHYAQAHPQHHVIALERTSEKFTAAEKYLAQHPLTNIQLIHADAIAWCVYALAPCSVDVFYILYPNPEPKNAQQRWVNMPFFEFLLSRLKPQGRIVMATNSTEYYEEAVVQLRDVWKVLKSHGVYTGPARTHFERKYMERGETCYFIECVKPFGVLTVFDTYNRVS